MKFRDSRPYAKALLVELQELDKQHKMNPNVAFKTTSGIILNELKKVGVLDIEPNSEAMFLFTLETMEAIAWSQWSITESQLYCFDNNLIEAFKNSSSLELCINDLRFPFQHSYFHFGTQLDMPLHDGLLYVEGAYVFYNKLSLRIILCGTWKEELSDEPMRPWYQRGRECYDLRIPSVNYDLPLEQAIDNALSRDIEDLKQADKELVAKSPYGTPSASQGFIEAHTKNKESYTKAINLITNALGYLTAYSHDDKVTWQKNSPERLVAQAESGSQKEKARAASKLKSLGFSVIHQIGEEFGSHVEKAKEGSSEQSSSRRVHWRRGHWRMQPHGPNNSLRRLTWITPVRVGVQTDDEVSRIRNIT